MVLFDVVSNLDPDIFWNNGQDCRIDELRQRFELERLGRDIIGRDLAAQVKQLDEENFELKLRLSLLLRLLISKGLITAPEFAAMIAEARPNSEDAAPQ